MWEIIRLQIKGHSKLLGVVFISVEQNIWYLDYVSGYLKYKENHVQRKWQHSPSFSCNVWILRKRRISSTSCWWSPCCPGPQTRARIRSPCAGKTSRPVRARSWVGLSLIRFAERSKEQFLSTMYYIHSIVCILFIIYVI